MTLPTRAADLREFACDIEQFTVTNVAERLGPRAIAALEREDAFAAKFDLTDESPLALLIRLFLLGSALTNEQIHTALPRSWRAAREWGLISGGLAAVDLRPTQIGSRDVWLAADLGEIATGEPLAADHVLGLGGASATLVDITIRTPVWRALDLGTGSGIQTLGLAGHAREIVATDISERALGFAQFNLALNEAMASLGPDLGQVPPGLVEVKHGSMFDAVTGAFDLIVSNPPFVISPRRTSLHTYTYRDAGQVGDAIVRDLIADVPRYLNPGGVAQILANWEVHKDQEWPKRIGEWVKATGIDAWVIQREYLDVAHYVHTWLRDGGLTPERDREGYQGAYNDWLADFDSRGVAGVGFGYVILRRPEAERDGWVRLEELTGTIAPALGETIAHTLDAVQTLASQGDEDLLAWHLSVPGDVTEERHYSPGSAHPSIIVLRQGGGFMRTVQVDTVTAAVVGACDGELALGDICRAVAQLLEVEADRVVKEVLPTVRGLISDGILVHFSSDRASLGK